MSVVEELHVGDWGTIIRVTVNDCSDSGSSVLDLSATTTKQIIFRKPDGTILTKTATFTTDGTDGKIQYTTVNGDIDIAGDWKIQVYLVFPSGSWRTDIGNFNVYSNL